MPGQLFIYETDDSINGTPTDDFILAHSHFGLASETISGGDGDDFILGDSNDHVFLTGTSTSMAAPANIDLATCWTVDENPFFRSSGTPHTSLYVLADGGQTHYSSVTVGAGQTITIDIDFGNSHPIGVNTDLIIELYDESGTLVASNDDIVLDSSDAGSRGTFDSFVTFTNDGAAALYTIRFREFGESDGGVFEGTETFIANISVTGHAVTTPTEMGDDILDGGIGDDTLAGQGGNDTLLGGAGNDDLFGGSGDDILDGGADTDSVSYSSASSGVLINLAVSGPQNTLGAGVDTLASIENVTGSAFNDTLFGSGVGNFIRAGAGADLVYAGGENDSVEGEAGNDRISGEAGNDHLSGDAGDDIIYGGDGDDVINGSDGNDLLHGDAGDDSITGSAGIDTVSYAGSTAGVSVNLSAPGTQDTLGAGIDSLNGIENLTGSAFGDTLSGDALNNILIGGAGNDTLYGVNGADWLDGGAGDDTLEGGNATDTASYSGTTRGVTVNLALVGPQDTIGAGNDTLVGIENLNGSAFVDTLSGDGLANSINGNGGNDLLRGGAGDDTLRGSEGNDTLDGGTGNDTLDGGNGLDVATYSAASAAVSVNLGVAVAQNTLGAGIDTLTAIENLIGSAFNDTLRGSSGANSLNGYFGNDVLYGLGGNDSLVGGDGNDAMDGGAGNDILDGGGGVDGVAYASATAAVSVNLGIAAGQNTGGAGIDTLIAIENVNGSNFNDTLTGNAGNNGIGGGAGNDLLNGRGGNDSLIGGAGQDRFHFDTALNAATNVDVMSDFTSADDTILLSTAIFTAIGAGTLSAAAFQAGTAANDAGDRIIYDSATGRIFYDADGNGAGAQVLFARVAVGTALSNLDFVGQAPAAEAVKSADEPPLLPRPDWAGVALDWPAAHLGGAGPAPLDYWFS